MSVNKWTAEEEHLLKTLRPTNTFAEIANQIQRRVDKQLAGFNERTDQAVRRKCERDDITPESCATHLDTNPVRTTWTQILGLQEEYTERSLIRTVGIVPRDKITTKILSVSDIHFPLAHVPFLREAVTTHSDADVGVVNGDLMEGYVFSSFEKHKRIAALDEYNCAFSFVEYLSKNFPKVVLVDGNHDIRISRSIKSNGFPKEASQILRPNLMARIANGERLDATGMLVEKLDFDNVFYEPRESWYVRVGKTIFVHPHGRGSSKPGFTVERLNKVVFGHRYQPDEYDSIVCGHTHKIYKGVMDSKLLIEQGCFVGLLKYAHDPKLKCLHNGMNGYAVIYQDAEGNTDFNLSGPIFLGEVLPPKKGVFEE